MFRCKLILNENGNLDTWKFKVEISIYYIGFGYVYIYGVYTWNIAIQLPNMIKKNNFHYTKIIDQLTDFM